MKPLKSKYGAQADTRHCLEGIPASWWIKYKGKRIVEILQELQRNTISCPGINSRVHHSTSALLRKGKEPPHMRFLAMLLARGSLPLQGHMLEILMEEDMGSLASWDDSDDPDPPTPDDSIDVWEAWAAAVTARLWPDEAELRRLLSPAQQAFRKATLGLEVTEVRRAELHWRIPSHDINLNADALEKHFTEIAAGNDGQLDSETVSQPNARGGWDLRHKNAGRPMGSVGGTAPADVIDDEDYEDGPRLSNRLKRKSGTRAEIEDQRDYLSEDPEDAWSELEGPQVIPTMFQSSDSKSRDLSYKGQRAAVPLQRDVITRKRARTLLSPELGEAHPSIRAKQRDTSSSEQDQDQDQVDLQHVYQTAVQAGLDPGHIVSKRPAQTGLASGHIEPQLAVPEGLDDHIAPQSAVQAGVKSGHTASQRPAQTGLASGHITPKSAVQAGLDSGRIASPRPAQAVLGTVDMSSQRAIQDGLGTSHIQVLDSARATCPPELIEAMMNTIRQNALEHDRSHGLIRETKWQLEHVRLEQHRLKDQEVEALDERSGITLLALENPEDGETQEVMRWVSEWIDKLQEAQGSYRDTEKRLSDTLLQFEVRKRQLAKKNEGYIDKLVRSGYVERRED